MAERAVSFVDRIEIDFQGTLLSHGISVGDADNDGDNELVIGSTNGQLFIMRGHGNKPWKACEDLGMITCVRVGDICNKGTNYVVCLSGEGFCHLFHLEPDTNEVTPPLSTPSEAKPGLGGETKTSTNEVKPGTGKVKPATSEGKSVGGETKHSTKSNASDVKPEIDEAKQGTSGKSDGKVKAGGNDVKTDTSKVKHNNDFKPVYTQRLRFNARRMLIVDADNDGKNELIVAHTDRHVSMYRWKEDAHLLDDEAVEGSLCEVETWQIAGQIGSISVHVTDDGLNEVLVSQPGGTYVTLLHRNQEKDRDKVEESGKNDDNYDGPYLYFHPFVHYDNNVRNANIGGMLIGNVRSNGKKRKVIGLQDGLLVMIKNDEVEWSFEREQHFAYVKKMDFTGDGNDEVIVCTYDGYTYILDHRGRVITSQIDETVASFACGLYAHKPGKNVPCLIYVTYQHKIYIYYDVRLPNLDCLSLSNEVKKNQEFKQLTASLDLESELKSSVGMQQFLHWILYNQQSEGEND